MSTGNARGVPDDLVIFSEQCSIRFPVIGERIEFVAANGYLCDVPPRSLDVNGFTPRECQRGKKRAQSLALFSK